MFDFLVYLGQSALCLAALYLIYKVAMSHETLHIFNRVVLLGSIILSALLPLCRVKIVKEYDVIPTVKTIEVDDMVVMENIPELEESIPEQINGYNSWARIATANVLSHKF